MKNYPNIKVGNRFKWKVTSDGWYLIIHVNEEMNSYGVRHIKNNKIYNPSLSGLKRNIDNGRIEFENESELNYQIH